MDDYRFKVKQKPVLDDFQIVMLNLKKSRAKTFKMPCLTETCMMI